MIAVDLESLPFDPVQILESYPILTAIYMTLPLPLLILWFTQRSRLTTAIRNLVKKEGDLESTSRKLDGANERIKGLNKKYEPIASIEAEVTRLKREADEAQQKTEQVRTTYKEKYHILKKLERQVAVYDETLSFAELGVYEPHFDYGDSELFKEKIKEIRQKQKDMVSEKIAALCPTDWTVDGSRSKGQTMINRQMRLTMRAFNNECEASIANTRWNNVVAMEKRILNAAKQINNANKSMNLIINEEYVSLKLDELHLTHEYRERRKIEKDERVELARVEREEKRLLAEAEAAEREEVRYQKLLDKARKEAGIDEGRIRELEAALAEAHATSERARAMAERTKSGYPEFDSSELKPLILLGQESQKCHNVLPQAGLLTFSASKRSSCSGVVFDRPVKARSPIVALWA